ncbi:MAG: MBL fold metallo-hydrolase [Chloroflexi bacterium]|nr:MBL fold metallo-hydrolase [Chloroflexota bacterium]
MTTSKAGSWPTGLQDIGNGVYAMITPDGGPNAGFVVCGEHVLVVDSLMTPAQARDFLAQIKRVTSKEIRFLVNTHYHLDHTFGNQFFSPPAQIISHANVRKKLLDLGGQAYVKEAARTRPEVASVTLVLPNVTLTGDLDLHLGDRLVRLLQPGHGHTNGDTVVYLPEQKVVFVGDLLFSKVTPAMHDGHNRRWMSILKKIAEMDIEVVVPGHGPLSSRAELEEERAFLREFRREVKGCFDKGMTVEQAVAAAKMERYSAWPFRERLERGVPRLYAELRGEI